MSTPTISMFLCDDDLEGRYFNINTLAEDDEKSLHHAH